MTLMGVQKIPPAEVNLEEHTSSATGQISLVK